MSAAPSPALEPVRQALLAAARLTAAGEVAAAHADARATGRRAAEAQLAIRAEAFADGESDGNLEVATRRRRTHREAQATVLSAQQEVYVDLRRRVHARLLALRDDPSYPELRRRLAAQAEALLGPGIEVVEADGGGIVARKGGRTLVLTFPVLADRALDALGEHIEGLWSA